jgi:16S rRNA (guanine1516-N2)-methyltransferase
MALVCVEPGDEYAGERAAAIAATLGVPLAGGLAPVAVSVPVPATKTAKLQPGVKLVVNSTGLALGFCDKSRGKPYVIDFLSAAWRSRFQSPLARNHIFRRALGVRDEPVHVLDATAGLAQDAMLALSLGCKVTAIERSAVLHALVSDALARAGEDEFMRMKIRPLFLVLADSLEYLSSPSIDRPDVIYLDPMFDKPKKSAKSPKEMQLLQELLDTPKAEDEEKLFVAAMAAAKDRVVVKRPLKARALKSAPSHSFKGQSIRYDVYVK